MDKFTETENIGRNKFQSWLEAVGITDYKFSEDKFDCIDCIFTKKDVKIAVEIKVRDEKYKNYTTHFIESVKFNNMNQLVENGEVSKAIYANFFGDWLYIYNLEKIDKEQTSVINAPITTAVYNGRKDKLMIEIPSNIASKFKNENGLWKKLKA